MKRLLGLLLCVLAPPSAAEVVVPIDSVEDHVNIRMSPDAKTEIVGRLFRGDSATIVHSTPEWHEIEIAGGATGFISTDWTIVLGNATDLVAENGQEKENIVELSPEKALIALTNLEPVTFNYKQDAEEQYVGFVAEDSSELVASADLTGLRTMEIVAVLTRVVQIQQQQIAELESKLEERE